MKIEKALILSKKGPYYCVLTIIYVFQLPSWLLYLPPWFKLERAEAAYYMPTGITLMYESYKKWQLLPKKG
tara:strand:+ start:160 stop:372 length:213 start_codon:yes stop_codon:yes gene_type:complete